MAEYQIKYVNLGGGNETHHITEVGGDGGNGWRLAVASVIANIQKGEHFYTLDGRGTKAYVDPWPNAASGPHIRSRPDGTQRDNLLSLPPIPPSYRVPGT